MATARLLVQCPDTKGLVHRITGFLFRQGANILHLDQHVDPVSTHFYLRIEWDLETYQYNKSEFDEYFTAEFGELLSKDMFRYSLFDDRNKTRIALFCSKQEHCLYDLLLRFKAGELNGEVVLVVSNHQTLKPFVDNMHLPFYHVDVKGMGKPEAEKQILGLMEANRIDCIVLARYMQILSSDFVANFPDRIINIHHSFLPAFPGAKPYHQAYERGVKIIGATSHYVTANLDAGPIIAQDIIEVDHEDSVDALVVKGKEVERNVLAQAVKLHLQNRILVRQNKTVVF